MIRDRFLYSFVDTLSQYSAIHIPAYSVLPYVNNMNNYISSIDFEFAGFKYGTKSESYVQTWDELTKDLEDVYKRQDISRIKISIKIRFNRDK